MHKLYKEHLLYMAHTCLVSLNELEELYKRFERLDRDHSGTLSVEEILGIPEFAMNPLAQRFIEMLNLTEEELDFTSFAQVLSVFHPKAKRIQKLQLTFKLYNKSGNGYITREELLNVLRLMAGHNLEEDELLSIVEQTFQDTDLNQDNLIDFGEFSSALLRSDSLKNMSITF